MLTCISINSTTFRYQIMRIISIFLITFILLSCKQHAVNNKIYHSTSPSFKEGDIIFHTSLSQQSKAIQLATHSKFSHCGVIIKNDNKFYVLEAVEPVKLTEVSKWINRGKDKRYVVKRLKNIDAISNADISKAKQFGISLLGKHYDSDFNWSNDEIYCSELVWKIYDKMGIQLSKPKQLKDFDLSNEIVQNKLKERYGKEIPYNEFVVSPEDIFISDKLETVNIIE